jgi:hypothetical protein
MRPSTTQIGQFQRDGYVLADGFLGDGEVPDPSMLKILPEGATPVLRRSA